MSEGAKIAPAPGILGGTGRLADRSRSLEKNGQPARGAYDGFMVTKTRFAPPQPVERVEVAREDAAQAVLRRGPATALTAEEERVMRMRLGASPGRATPLERTAQGLTDLEIEVYAAEIEAYMKWKARGAHPAAARRPAVPSRTKEKIIRALRRK
jgi:hypothetical protein